MDRAAAAPRTFADHAGSVALSLVKHVPTRAALWSVIGFFVGIVCVAASFAIGLLVLDRGALLLGYLVVVPIAIPFLGAALFAIHGLHRGAARAALELERKYGLVRYVVRGVIGFLVDAVGGPITNLPLQQLETKLKSAVARYLRVSEGRGVFAWVVDRAKRRLTRKIEAYLLSAYRAELQADGSGGGVSLEKLGAAAEAELSRGVARVVMSPLNKQLALFMALYVVVAVGWWYWLMLLASALSFVAGK